MKKLIFFPIIFIWASLNAQLSIPLITVDSLHADSVTDVKVVYGIIKVPEEERTNKTKYMKATVHTCNIFVDSISGSPNFEVDIGQSISGYERFNIPLHNFTITMNDDHWDTAIYITTPAAYRYIRTKITLEDAVQAVDIDVDWIWAYP